MSAELDRVRATLDRHRKLFDLTRDDLGKALCKAATDGVHENIAGEHAPDGTPWDKLSAGYAEWKSFHYPGQAMGVLHGTMANPREVAGRPDVATDRAEVTYGVTERARKEYAWFSEGDPAANRPARPSWGFTAASLAEVGKILDARFATA
jgi:hypothetical protein